MPIYGCNGLILPCLHGIPAISRLFDGNRKGWFPPQKEKPVAKS